MTLKIIRFQEGVPTYVAKLLPENKNWPELDKKRPAKITPEIARSALSGDLSLNDPM